MRLEHKRVRQAGFSLVELLVVVAIIVILSAVALPSIAEYLRHYRLRGASEQVVGEIQRARATAIMKDVNFGVLFTVLSPTTYRIVNEDPQATSADVTRGQRVTVAIATEATNQLAQTEPLRTLPDGVEFKPGGCGTAGTMGGALRFSRLGMMCQPGSDPNTCPAVTTGGTATPLAFGGANAQLCLHDRVRVLGRLITVSGGHVFSQAMVP